MIGKMKKLDQVFARACFRWTSEGAMPERLHETKTEAEVACGHCFTQRNVCLYKLKDRNVKEMCSLEEAREKMEQGLKAFIASSSSSDVTTETNDASVVTDSDNGQLLLDDGNDPVEPSVTK